MIKSTQLGRIGRTMTKVARQESSQPTKLRNLVSTFSLLTVNEPMQEPLNAPDIEQHQQMNQDGTTDEAVPKFT